jgi:hypothetical protein
MVQSDLFQALTGKEEGHVQELDMSLLFIPLLLESVHLATGSSKSGREIPLAGSQVSCYC